MRSARKDFFDKNQFYDIDISDGGMQEYIFASREE